MLDRRRVYHLGGESLREIGVLLLVFGPLVITDLPVTLFSLAAIWRLGEIWDAPSPRNALLFGAAFACLGTTPA